MLADPKVDRESLLLKYGTTSRAVALAFLAAGVNVRTAVDKNGYTILHKLALSSADCYDLIADYIEAMAPVRAKDSRGNQPLHLAAKRGKINLIRALLDAGVHIGECNGKGMTPLHYAAREGHTAVVQKLLNEGASVDARNKKLLTPLHYAVRKGYFDIAQKLLLNGAFVGAKGADDWAPLPLLMAKKGNDKKSSPMIKLLAQASVDADAYISKNLRKRLVNLGAISK